VDKQPIEIYEFDKSYNQLKTKFNVGDRVMRDESDPYVGMSGKVLHGTVTRVYSDYEGKFGPYPELYEVNWDNYKLQRGFLPHGLELEVQIGVSPHG